MKRGVFSLIIIMFPLIIVVAYLIVFPLSSYAISCKNAFSEAQFKFWEGGSYLDKPTKPHTHLVVFYQGPSSGFDHTNVKFRVDGKIFTPEGSITTAVSGNVIIEKPSTLIEIITGEDVCASKNIQWSSSELRTSLQSCTDSDENNIYNEGYVTGADDNGELYREDDSCIDSTELKEWICDGELPKDLKMSCGKCENGKCNKMDSTVVLPHKTITKICTDSDEGDIYMRGKAVFEDEKGKITKTDHCIEEEKIVSKSYMLLEADCNGNTIEEKKIRCKCEAGACMEEPGRTWISDFIDWLFGNPKKKPVPKGKPTSTCIDSDGGPNYYESGFVEGTLEDGTPFKTYDNCRLEYMIIEQGCLDDKPYTEENFCAEFYSGELRETKCIDGACILPDKIPYGSGRPQG